MYIAVDCWIALNRVVTSKDTVLLICLNQRSGVKRIPQQLIRVWTSTFQFPLTSAVGNMAGMRRLKVVNVVISRTVFNAHIEREEATASPLKDVHTGYDPRGGALGYFLGGYVPPLSLIHI